MQKANPICGPNFYNGSPQRNVAINIDAGRNFLPEFFLIRKQAASVRLLSFFRNKLLGGALAGEKGLNGRFAKISGFWVIDHSALFVLDVKNIDRQAIFPGNRSRSKNVETGHGECSGDFFKQTGSVLGDDIHNSEGATQIISPIDNRIGGLGAIASISMNHFHMQGYFFPSGMSEIAYWNLLQMVHDFIFRNSVDHHALVCVLKSVGILERPFPFKHGQSVREEMRMKFLLVVIPKVGSGCVRVTVGVNVEKSQPLLSFDEIGEGINHFGIIKIEFVRVSDHLKVIANHEKNAVAHFIRNSQPVHHMVGNFDASFTMSFWTFVFPQVMQKKNQIKQSGNFVFS